VSQGAGDKTDRGSLDLLARPNPRNADHPHRSEVAVFYFRRRETQPKAPNASGNFCGTMRCAL